MLKKAFLVLLVVAAPVFGGNYTGRYFMTVYGYEGPGNRPVDSHTFATFVSGDEIERRGVVERPATISWLPRTGVVVPIGVHPGKNFSLAETLRIARTRGYTVRHFGPYEITYDLYERALDQINHLNSGAERYKMVAGPFGLRGLNCIHAVSNIGGGLFTFTAHGFDASRAVTEFLSRDIRNFPRTHDDVFARIRQ